MIISTSRSRAVAATMAVACLVAILVNKSLAACTAFCAVGNGMVLVGNNEDYFNPRTKLWFVTGKSGTFGRMYVGFDNLQPGGGMNERGLWFDVFTTAWVEPKTDLPSFSGDIIDHAMATCATVEEVVRLFSQYHRAFLSEATLMFADASGDAASIEANAIVRKTGQHFVQTNFHQSEPGDRRDWRFPKASQMLAAAGGGVSVELAERILGATYQKGSAPTLYSNIYDLRARTMRLYYFHDFTKAVTFDLAEELRKGDHVLNIADLFAPNAASEAFAARRKDPRPSSLVFFPASFVIIVVLIVGVAIGVIRGGRRVRIAIAAVFGIVAACALLAAAVLEFGRPHRAEGWTDFSIGPASGTSVWVGTDGLRGNGMSLLGAVSTAYDVPVVRVVAPSWLAETRYAMSASAPRDGADTFRELLKQELAKRLHLETHTETRPFDVFVLTAVDASRLAPSRGIGLSIWNFGTGTEIQDASATEIAAALQYAVRKPVIDETGLAGKYDLDVNFSEDNRVASASAAVELFGLRLTPARRDLQALVVDHARRDASLVLMSQIGRAISIVPPGARERLAKMVTMR